MIVDCGELSGEDYEKATDKIPDETGDPYEDFPEDQKAGDEEWKGDEILSVATALKDLGNKAFKAGNLQLGIQKYQKGLRYLHEYPAPLDSDPPELGGQLNALKISLYLNSALLQNKVGQYADAAESASKALEIQGITEKDMAKAYFRRGQARSGRKNEEDALKDLETASKYAPGDAAITKELDTVKRRVKERREKEKKAYSKAFA